MCGFCGQYTARRHWSAGPDRSRAPSPTEKLRLAALAGRVLSAYGIAVRGWAGGLQLSGPTGRHVLIRDMGGLWHGADQVSESGFDPLDQSLLDRLEASPDPSAAPAAGRIDG